MKNNKQTNRNVLVSHNPPTLSGIINGYCREHWGFCMSSHTQNTKDTIHVYRREVSWWLVVRAGYHKGKQSSVATSLSCIVHQTLLCHMPSAFQQTAAKLW